MPNGIIADAHLNPERNMKSLFNMKYLATVIFAFVTVGFLAFVAFNISFLNPISRVMNDFSFTDIYYQILSLQGKQETTVGITLIDMTDVYDRKDIAKSIADIERYNPKAIGVDIVFEGLLDNPEGNDSLVSVASGNKNIIYSYRLADYIDEDTGYATDIHSFFTDFISVREGYTNMERNLYGGMKRKLSLKSKVNGEWMPSFITEVVNEYAGGGMANIDGEMLDINFMPVDFAKIDVNAIHRHPEIITNRIVLLGAMHEESDMHYTPIGKMAGMELLAYSIRTMIDYRELRHVPTYLFWTITFMLVYVTSLWNDKLVKRSKRLHNKYLRGILSSSYFVSVVTFLWMAFLTLVAFVLFCKYNINFSLGWAFATMACLEISKDLYEACLNIFGNAANNKSY